MLVGRIPQDFNQRMLRAFACRVDQLGIDPLQDAIVPRLLEINSFSLLGIISIICLYDIYYESCRISRHRICWV